MIRKEASPVLCKAAPEELIKSPYDMEKEPCVRLCEVARPAEGSCGFHLSRTQWDPYPWVSGVEAGSPAHEAGLRAGDCVLRVNGEDVLGRRIADVAQRVRAHPDKVVLLLWNAGADPNPLCGGGTPLSLHRLTVSVQGALQLLECPVCLETVRPPAAQCCNGHVLCAGCRARADRCPVCRVHLGPRGRCLLADKLHSLLAATFATSHDHRTPEEVRSLPEETPLHCPNGPECRATSIGASALMAHLHSHGGPLLHYFCQSAKVPLPLPALLAFTPGGDGSPTYFLSSRGQTVWMWSTAAVPRGSYKLLADGMIQYGVIQSLTSTWEQALNSGKGLTLPNIADLTYLHIDIMPSDNDKT